MLVPSNVKCLCGKCFQGDVFTRREKILRYTAGRIQGEAQRRSAIPPGDIARGRVSGNLQASIQIKEPEKSPSGRSVSLTVWANPAAAKSKSGKPYARFEELGTGEYSEAPEAPKQPIRPHGGKPFMWIQTGKPYRRWPYVKALARVRKPVPTPFHGKRPWRKLKGGGIVRSYNKITTTEWLQV